MKKLTCEVCGTEFEPTVKRHYISQTSGLFPTFHDAYDCPECGSQYVAKEREPSLIYYISQKNYKPMADEEGE